MKLHEIITDAITDQFGGISTKRILAWYLSLLFGVIVIWHMITGQNVQDAIIAAIVALITVAVGGTVAEHWSKKITNSSDEAPKP